MTDTQLSLIPRARNTDDRASHDAAKRATKRAGQYDAGIFDLLTRYSALTKNQICAHLGLKEPKEWATVSSRLSQLRGVGKVEWTGRRIEGDGNEYRLVTNDVPSGGVL